MAGATTGQRTVLVIEDDPWTRTITTALLAGEGVAGVQAGGPFVILLLSGGFHFYHQRFQSGIFLF